MARKPTKAEVEGILLAEEDLAAMRPALAVAPELMLQALQRQRKRGRKPVRKKVKARKSSPKKARKSAPKKKKAKKAARKK
jgi:hypothetical protein